MYGSGSLTHCSWCLQRLSSERGNGVEINEDSEIEIGRRKEKREKSTPRAHKIASEGLL